jgi:hypothetical protein
MRRLADPVVGYVSAVVAILALATLAGLHLRGSMTRSHRHWDASIGRVIAQQQEKRLEMEIAAVPTPSELTSEAVDAALAIPELTTGQTEKAILNDHEESRSQKVQNESRRKSGRRADRKQQPPASVITLPQLAVTATTALIPLR